MQASACNSREILSLLAAKAKAPTGSFSVGLWDGRVIACLDMSTAWFADIDVVDGSNVEALNMHLESLLVYGKPFVAVWFKGDGRMYRLYLD